MRDSASGLSNHAAQLNESIGREKERRMSSLSFETRLPPRPSSVNDGSSSPNTEQRQQQHCNSLYSRRPLPNPNQVNRRVSQMKHRLDTLRGQSNDVAVRITIMTVENDEREEEGPHINSAPVRLARERLDRMWQ